MNQCGADSPLTAINSIKSVAVSPLTAKDNNNIKCCGQSPDRVKDAEIIICGQGTDRDTLSNEDEIQVKYSRHLPHWTKTGSIYTVRMRLADSAPEKIISEWQRERDWLLKEAEHKNLLESEKSRIRFLYSNKVDKFIDTGYGECLLKEPSVAEIIIYALKFYDGDRYHLHAYCIMPNHIHLILEPLNNYDLLKICRDFKHYTAKKANQVLKRNGTIWLDESYDHLIRDELDYIRCLDYLWQNPEKAGFKDWQWRWIK